MGRMLIMVNLSLGASLPTFRRNDEWIPCDKIAPQHAVPVPGSRCVDRGVVIAATRGLTIVRRKHTESASHVENT